MFEHVAAQRIVRVPQPAVCRLLRVRGLIGIRLAAWPVVFALSFLAAKENAVLAHPLRQTWTHPK